MTASLVFASDSVCSVFSVVRKPSLNASLPFALNSSEDTLNLPFLHAFFEIGSLICSHFALANAEGNFNTPLLPIHFQGNERATSLFRCAG